MAAICAMRVSDRVEETKEGETNEIRILSNGAASSSDSVLVVEGSVSSRVSVASSSTGCMYSSGSNLESKSEKSVRAGLFFSACSAAHLASAAALSEAALAAAAAAASRAPCASRAACASRAPCASRAAWASRAPWASREAWAAAAEARAAAWAVTSTEGEAAAWVVEEAVVDDSVVEVEEGVLSEVLLAGATRTLPGTPAKVTAEREAGREEELEWVELRKVYSIANMPVASSTPSALNAPIVRVVYSNFPEASATVAVMLAPFAGFRMKTESPHSGEGTVVSFQN